MLLYIIFISKFRFIRKPNLIIMLNNVIQGKQIRIETYSIFGHTNQLRNPTFSDSFSATNCNIRRTGIYQLYDDTR